MFRISVYNCLKNYLKLNKFSKFKFNDKTDDPMKNVDTKLNLFNECELRVGKVIEVDDMENSNDIYCLKIEVGEQNLREVGTSLRKFISSDQIKNSLVVVFANLKPRKLGNFVSNGMILCCKNQQLDKLEILRPNLSI